MNDGPSGQTLRFVIDGIPVLCTFPEQSNGRLALWITHLGGAKEDGVSALRRFAQVGFVGVSLDPWHHGERSPAPSEALSKGVLGAFRPRMWPILGRTTLDAMHIIDWAEETYGVASHDVIACGVSMGGDIVIALAGADSRVSRIAAIGSTPDWTRPGMRHIDQPSVVVDQKEPSATGQWLYQKLDPMSNLDAYNRAPAMAFELGQNDTHVPPNAALLFRERLAAEHPAAAEGIRITQHTGLDHSGLVKSPTVRGRALEWVLND